MTKTSITKADVDGRIAFHDDDEIMEVSFADIAFGTTAEVNFFYDRIEERIAATGEEKWFFLVDYSGARIDSAAWSAFARRGRALNKAHSQGTVRFDASDITRQQIERAAGTEAFDPNLFDSREAALARLRELPSERTHRIVLEPTLARGDVAHRLHFFPDTSIMEADFSGLTLVNAKDADVVYDLIEERLVATGRKWFFLVNYEGTSIEPGAWVQYARRGKSLNQRWSLGSVRYAPGMETEADIRLRAESQGFRPNIRNTRDEALALIADMRALEESAV